ncbi:MAG: DNA methyltransferase, partial [Anaerolineae bacterium]|nr:DNA methyltransferase [Anaerolineae bacterium]
RPYKEVDERIKQTYIKHGTAQNQIGVYDMYTRFFRWATDRLGDDGIIAFITNNSFIDARSYDGFRKVIADEFDYAYIIDLGGNVRAISGRDGIFIGAEHTIFGASAAVGIAITFLVKDSQRTSNPCRINYIHPTSVHALRDEKIAYLQANRLRDIPFQLITPSKRHNWINQTDNDFEELLPVAAKKGDAIFSLYSNGLKTQRDEWVYDFSAETLEHKVRFLINTYEASRKNPDYAKRMQIKWDHDLKSYRDRQLEISFNPEHIVRGLYRPFLVQYLYFDWHLNGRTYQLPSLFPYGAEHNPAISLGGYGRKPFATLATDGIPDLNFYGDPAQWLALYRYDDLGNRVDNITDWALAQFRAHYAAQDPTGFRNPSGLDTPPTPTSSPAPAAISKRDIFHYVYAVLHHPAYRQKYELNLKRDFPRIPFYADFWQWAAWGERLMDLHLHYEMVDPYPLDRHDADPDAVRARYKAKLSADTEQGVITLDTYTTLSGVPDVAWTYRLGNRSALEWILDRYKERKPRDPTIREKFNTYRFADYKEHVIDLLCRVTTVSVETMAIVNVMPASVEEAL